jgi:hypothetical protein
MASREDVRHTLIQRVTRKVSGHGISSRSVESAVDRVLSALPDGLDATRTPTPQIAVLSAVSAPDLPSRARRVLGRHGAQVVAMGTGTAGRHTVVTVQLAANPGPGLERAAAELGASLSLLDPADAGRFNG